MKTTHKVLLLQTYSWKCPNYKFDLTFTYIKVFNKCAVMVLKAEEEESTCKAPIDATDIHTRTNHVVPHDLTAL